MEGNNFLKFVALASTEEEAVQFGKWLTETEPTEGCFRKNYNNFIFQGYSRWPEFPKSLSGVSTYDAIIIRIKNPEEWSLMRDYVHERSLIQFKAVIYDEEIPSIIDEINPTFAIKFDENKNLEILEELIKAENELDILLEGVFKNFDKTGDGYIDLNDIETICRELGLEVTHSEFKEALQSLDVNHDNKISINEFKDWFKRGRKCTHLMESLISMRLATNTFNSLINSKYLKFIQEKLDYLHKVKKEIINSFLSVNIEKLSNNPEVLISLDGYFGGEVMETISKSYVQNFEEGLKSTDLFMIVEFQLKDPSKIEHLQHFLINLTDAMRESFRGISKRMFSLINNDISIKVIKKDMETLCLSIKIKRGIKDELLTIENNLRYLLDEELTQSINLSFGLSGHINNVRENPNADFLDSFEPATSVQVKTEILKKNIKLLLKYFKPLPRWLKFWLNSYGGSNINFNFNLDYIKSMNTSFLKQPNCIIVEFLKSKINEILYYYLTPLSGASLFKKFFDSVKENYTIVINTPQFHLATKIDITGLIPLINE